MRHLAAVAACCLVILAGIATARAAEDGSSATVNLWPIFDDRVDPLEKSRVRSGAGPLVHSSRSLDGDVTEFAFRPFFFRREEQAAQRLEWEFLYPLMTYRRSGSDWDFQFLRLLNARGEGSPRAGREERTDFFPFFFSGVRNDGETSLGIMPFWGHVHDRFFWEEFDWVMFPLYARSVRTGTETHYFPWPLISTRSIACP